MPQSNPPSSPARWGLQPLGSFQPSPDFTDDELAAALDEANLPVLLGALAVLTGQDRWIKAPYLPTPPPGLGDHDSGGFDEVVRQQIIDEATEVLRAWRDGTETFGHTPPEPDRLALVLSVMLGETIPAE